MSVACETESDESGYKGDSVGKKMTRVYLWARIVKHLRSNGLDGGRIAYLASREGGDASTLGALGWPAERQLAIDRDRGALAAFSKLHPNVPTELGDCGEIVAQGRFAAVYLDFCGPATDAVIEIVARCAKSVVQNGRIAYCVMRGRERGAKVADIKASAARKQLLWSDRVGADRQRIEKALADLRLKDPARPPAMSPRRAAAYEELIRANRELRATAQDYLDAMTGLSRAETENLPSDFRSRCMDGRAELFWRRAQTIVRPARIELAWRTFIAYHSRTDRGHGVPMMVEDLLVRRHGQGMDRSRFDREVLRNADCDMGLRASWASPPTPLAPGQSIMDSIISLPMVRVDLTGCTRSFLVSQSRMIDFQFGHGRAAEALNVTAGRLAAWKAVETRRASRVEYCPQIDA